MKPRDPWKSLEPDDAIRVDSQGRYDFFWVALEAGRPGLMLKLPSFPHPKPRLPKLKYLDTSIQAAPSGSVFVIGLKERSQIELFETLCLNVVEAGEAGEDWNQALSKAIQRTFRWHHLLRSGKSVGLSVEEQRGLVGELALLRNLLSAFRSTTAIEAWTGPTGSTKDFELIGTCIEVKSRRVSAKPVVTISSEDQLADVAGSRLFLHVVNVASAVLPQGRNLHDHVRLTADLLEEDSGAIEAWEEALYSTGYDPENDYDDRRWLLGEATNYEVVDGFPRISLPLPQGVENARYSVSLEACEPFKFEDDLIEVVRKGLKI